MMDVGIDVGGTNLRAGVVDEQGKLLSRVSQPVGTLKSPEELIRRLAELAQKAVEDAGTPENQIQSVGVGIPGAVSEGNILYTCNLPLRDVPFEQLFRRFFDRPVYLENDANCAAAGEWLYGAGRGRKNFVMVTLGTGLGGGFILNGKLYGGGGMAGEIGHMVIRRDGPACGCGRRGCWEAYSSATALIRQARQAAAEHPESLLAGAEEITGKTVFDAADRGDETANAVVDRFCDYLGAGVTNIVNALAPEVILIGGGISRQGERLLAPVRRYVEKNCFGGKDGAIPIIAAARLGNDAGIIGAAAL